MKSARVAPAAVIGALGIVYGDIGTSPLYALEQAVNAANAHGDPAFGILGVLSLIFWSLAIIVTGKYVLLMLRADNQGEGGILALFALVQKRLAAAGRWQTWLVALGVLGAALFYCDALITPAISVLSAVEGLELLDPHAERIVVPTTLVIVIVLFVVQRRGTARIGEWFGPVMLLWFGILALTGGVAIVRDPQVLVALNPLYGLELLARRADLALVILGAVFLAMTGAEALYADMGHFGKQPVRVAWIALVWPALVLQYFGQGAYCLAHGGKVSQPLYALVPGPLVGLMVVLATFATVIASQATITGAFSVTRQAVQLDLLPRLRILQTSASERGQIYVPIVNVFMFVAVSLFVVAFGSSAALGSAYGSAVAGTMLITTVLGAFVARTAWSWQRGLVGTVFGPLLVIDAAYFVGNLTKIADGGWVPILLALIMFTLFMTWRDGRLRLREALRRSAVPIGDLPKVIEGLTRVPGTAIFLVSDPEVVPAALLRNIQHNHVAHQRIVILHIEILRIPRQDPGDRVRIDTLLPDAFMVHARYGFMETPDVSEALRRCRTRGLKIFPDEASFFLGWHLVRPRPRSGWAGMRGRVFAWMQRRSTQAAEFFRMPSRRVVILATDVEI
jgi:KUP system potassium uptake protein